MMKIRILGLVAAVLLLGRASAVQADTITVTGGSFVGDNNMGALSLVSDQFDLTLQGFNRGIQATGQMLSPNTFQLNLAVNGNFSGYGVVDGSVYPPSSAAAGPLTGTASLLFTTSALEASPANTSSLTTPFNLTGSLLLVTPARTLNTNLVSSGVLTMLANGITTQANGTVAFNGMQLRFSSTAAGASATPEPATMLLFTSGVVAMVGARKLRRRLE